MLVLLEIGLKSKFLPKIKLSAKMANHYLKYFSKIFLEVPRKTKVRRN